MRFDTRTIGVFEVLSVQLVADEVFDAGRLRQETLRLVEKGSRRIVVDLGGVDYLYSDSINALVALNRRMLESSGRMGILVPHPKVYDILVRAGLENIMRLYRSEAELQSDSRELMRQSSAWTRPAELLSAASASQVLSASVMVPKNPSDLRDAASASQRIPRRRVGSRVELKPRRRGGRGLDQEQPTGEFQLPPILPALPGESTTLRTLSQDSSAFDQQSTFSKTTKVPKQPIQPRPEPPQAPVEPSVFNVPENTRHDGYSTDAWLLSLTSPAQAAPTTPEQIVAETAAGSSSFLPKVSSTAGQNLQDAPSKFSTEFAWDESEISLTDSPYPAALTPPPAPIAPAVAPPPSPWLNQPAPQAPTAPVQPKAAPTPPPTGRIPAPAPQSPKPTSPFFDGPHSSAFLDDSVAGSTVTSASNVDVPSQTKPKDAPADPWLTPSPTRPAAQPDIQSAIFHDHPSTPPAGRQSTASASHTPPSAQAAPQPAPTKPVIPEAVAPKAPSASPESWFSGTPVKPKPAAESRHAPAPQAPVSAPAKSGANSLDAWFGAGAATPETTPAKPHPRSTPPSAASSASALDWVTPTPAAKPVVETAKQTESVKPTQTPAVDPWIAAAPAAAQPAAPQTSPKPAPAKAQAAALDSWISSAPTTPIAKPVAPESVAPAPAPTTKPQQPSPVDSWLSATPPAPVAKQAPVAPHSSKDAPVGGTAWLESSKPHRKPVPAPKEPTSFLDLDDLDGQKSSNKPLVFALSGLALVAVIGLGIFFFGGSKKSVGDVPPSTTPAESTSVAPEPSQPETESVKPAPAESKSESEEAEPDSKSKSKSKSKKPETKTDSKTKQKASTEKTHASAKEAAKPLPAPVAAPAPVPEEVHAPVKIFVTSRPSGAAVTLDGARMGTTPCEITFKRVGKLEFNLAGYRKQTKEIDPDETRGTVNVQLSADGGNSGTGRIYISSAPVGAEIVVGGKVVGKTPKLVELPTGSQKVTVRSGVLSKTKSIDIQSGTNTAENFSL